MSAMPTANAERLLSVVKGDWTPYEQRQTYHTFAEKSRTLETVNYDWDLLRHDIHVALHRATAPR